MSENGYKLRRTKGRLGADYVIQTARWFSTRYWFADRKQAVREVVPASVLAEIEPDRKQKAVRNVNGLGRKYEEALADQRGFDVVLGKPRKDGKGWTRSVSSSRSVFLPLLEPQMRANADFSKHIEECFDGSGQWKCLPTRAGGAVLVYVRDGQLLACLMPIVGKRGPA